MKLAVNHESPVGSEQMRHGRDGKFARLVRVAEQQFAGSKGSPGLAVSQKFSLSRLRASLDAEVVRIAEAVGEAKMFARRRLAVDDLGCRILLPI